MTELVSMLVPLQGTLPGWPTVAQPSAVQVLGLLFGVPLIVIIVISLIGKGPELIRAGRGEDQSAAGEPLWLGTAPADRGAVTAGPDAPAAPPVPARAPESATTVGGASVRW
ncbi:hypothetical protein GCM10011575_19130 [Microlunatus endophyticus]|uniref:Uncharacterized protein n=1 Tax=Microlunatus endophyticus TaxID=1716077 RepID=A0A917W2J9_9ACTN|nr:hypothetical protein [Microlunatus endophyticus]GGL60783.1 hypothetical protein GCM10011575_19130 [Microlunatus endophyticus]